MSIKKYNPITGKWEVQATKTASETTVLDITGKFKSKNVEGVLEELYQQANSVPTDLEERVANIEGMIESGQLGGGGSGGGGGSTTLPTITSTYEGGTIELDTELIMPLFFSSPNLGSGSLYVSINGVEVTTISVRQGSNTINLGKLNQGTNKIELYAKDRSGLLSNQLAFDVICGGLIIKMNFDYSADYTVDDNIRMPFTVETISEQPIIMHMTIDHNTTDVVCNKGYNEYTFSKLGVGIHTISYYLESDKYTSRTISFNLVIVDSDSLYVTMTIPNDKYRYGVTIPVNYRISKMSSETFNIQLYIDDTLSKQVQAGAGTYYWNVSGLTEGDHKLKVVASSELGETAYAEGSVNVYYSDYIPKQTVTTGLVLNLDATNRSNQDIDKETWNDEEHGVTATLHNFNFSSNGWLNGALVCDNDTYVEIDATPWKDNVPLGSTIEIIYTPKNIGMEEARVLDYTNSNAPNNGIYINVLETALSSTVSTGKVSLDDEEEEIAITYVIDRDNKFAKIYVNGVICRAFYLTDSGSGVNKFYENFSHAEKIYLNSEKGEKNSGACIIRKLRVYNRTLTNDEIMQNRLADIVDIDEQQEMYDFYYNNTNMPVIRLSGDTTHMTGDTAVEMRVKYTSPNEELYGENFDLNYCQVKWQGTSSLQYNIKNYTIYLKDNNKKDYYYNPFVNGIDEHIFCLKCDYMESSHAHNVGCAKFINDCVYDTKNPAQKDNPKVRNTVNGFPIMLYLNDEYIGIYNFNLDRYSTASYGYDEKLYPKCLSYEINANSDYTAGAFNKWTIETGKTEDEYFKEDFTCRFPATRANGNDTMDELKRLVNWVSDASDELFKEQINEYFNKEYLIRYYLCTMIFGLVDNLGKNMMLTTWDGLVWYPQFYDLD